MYISAERKGNSERDRGKKRVHVERENDVKTQSPVIHSTVLLLSEFVFSSAQTNKLVVHASCFATRKQTVFGRIRDSTN